MHHLRTRSWNPKSQGDALTGPQVCWHVGGRWPRQRISFRKSPREITAMVLLSVEEGSLACQSHLPRHSGAVRGSLSAVHLSCCCSRFQVLGLWLIVANTVHLSSKRAYCLYPVQVRSFLSLSKFSTRHFFSPCFECLWTLPSILAISGDPDLGTWLVLLITEQTVHPWGKDCDIQLTAVRDSWKSRDSARGEASRPPTQVCFSILTTSTPEYLFWPRGRSRTQKMGAACFQSRASEWRLETPWGSCEKQILIGCVAVTAHRVFTVALSCALEKLQSGGRLFKTHLPFTSKMSLRFIYTHISTHYEKMNVLICFPWKHSEYKHLIQSLSAYYQGSCFSNKPLNAADAGNTWRGRGGGGGARIRWNHTALQLS